MYQIMDPAVRSNVRLQFARAWRTSKEMYELLGGSVDSSFCFAVAADQDALADRLVQCAIAHYGNAALMHSPAARLYEVSRGLELIIKASETRMFANRMLDYAIVFERAANGACATVSDTERGERVGAAAVVWAELMSDHILSERLYEYADAMYESNPTNNWN